MPADTLTGDSIQLSGYGLGYGTTQPTQEQRTAIMGLDDAETYDVSGPIHWGDSGGPLVHKRTGKALGIVSRLCAGACSEEGPTVQGILAKAAAAGYRGHAPYGLAPPLRLQQPPEHASQRLRRVRVARAAAGEDGDGERSRPRMSSATWWSRARGPSPSRP